MKHTQPASDLYSMYSFLLDRTSRRVKQYAKTEFKAFGFQVTVDQWVILKKLYENGPVHQVTLGEITFKDAPTLTRIVDILCRKGLVERQDCQDRRKFSVAITPLGRQLTEDMLPKVSAIRQKAWDGLGPPDFEHFKKTLETIYNNLNTEASRKQV